MIPLGVGPHRRGRRSWPRERVVGGVLYGAFAAGVATVAALPALRWWLPWEGMMLLVASAVLLLLPSGPGLALFTLVRLSAAKLRAAAGAVVLTVLAIQSAPAVSAVGAAVRFDREADRLEALVEAMRAAGVRSFAAHTWPRQVNGLPHDPPATPSVPPGSGIRPAELARIEREIDALHLADVRVAEGGAVILLSDERWVPYGATLVLRRTAPALRAPGDLRMIQDLGGGWYLAVPTHAPY